MIPWLGSKGGNVERTREIIPKFCQQEDVQTGTTGK
jgi:hypothetical protein